MSCHINAHTLPLPTSARHRSKRHIPRNASLKPHNHSDTAQAAHPSLRDILLFPRLRALLLLLLLLTGRGRSIAFLIPLHLLVLSTTFLLYARYLDIVDGLHATHLDPNLAIVLVLKIHPNLQRALDSPSRRLQKHFLAWDRGRGRRATLCDLVLDVCGLEAAVGFEGLGLLLVLFGVGVLSLAEAGMLLLLLLRGGGLAVSLGDFGEKAADSFYGWDEGRGMRYVEGFGVGC